MNSILRISDARNHWMCCISFLNNSSVEPLRKYKSQPHCSHLRSPLFHSSGFLWSGQNVPTIRLSNLSVPFQKSKPFWDGSRFHIDFGLIHSNKLKQFSTYFFSANELHFRNCQIPIDW